MSLTLSLSWYHLVISWKFTFFLAGSQNHGGGGEKDERSIGFSQSAIEDARNCGISPRKQVTKSSSCVKVVARRNVEVPLFQVSLWDETPKEPSRRPWVEGCLVEILDYGSGSTMVKTSLLPLTPCELFPVNETMSYSQGDVESCLVLRENAFRVLSLY